MNINDLNHYEVVPKKEYEEMVRIVNDKQYIRVDFILYNREWVNYSERLWPIGELHTSYDISTDSLNRQIHEAVFKEAENMVIKACNEVARKKDETIKELKDELKTIHSKWWYKLFA